MLYESARQFDKAASVYIKIKNWCLYLLLHCFVLYEYSFLYQN